MLKVNERKSANEIHDQLDFGGIDTEMENKMEMETGVGEWR